MQPIIAYALTIVVSSIDGFDIFMLLDIMLEFAGVGVP